MLLIKTHKKCSSVRINLVAHGFVRIISEIPFTVYVLHREIYLSRISNDYSECIPENLGEYTIEISM